MRTGEKKADTIYINNNKLPALHSTGDGGGMGLLQAPSQNIVIRCLILVANT